MRFGFKASETRPAFILTFPSPSKKTAGHTLKQAMPQPLALKPFKFAKQPARRRASRGTPRKSRFIRGLFPASQRS